MFSRACIALIGPEADLLGWCVAAAVTDLGASTGANCTVPAGAEVMVRLSEERSLSGNIPFFATVVGVVVIGVAAEALWFVFGFVIEGCCRVWFAVLL